jgi:hypothetical protein
MKSNRLERYLQEASQGLYGKQRKIVIKELRGNLEQHVKERMAFGMSEVAAYEEMLDAFGAPQIVSRGMWGVHMKPMVLKIGAVLGLTTALSLPFVVASASSVSVFQENGMGGTYWVGFESVFRALKWDDASINIKGNQIDIKKGKYKLLSMQIGEVGGMDTFLKKVSDDKYMRASVMVNMLHRYSGLPVFFDSPVNPKFSIGGRILDLQNGRYKVDLSQEIASNIGSQFAPTHQPRLNSWEENSFPTIIYSGAGYQHYIKANAEPNHLYLAISAGWVKTKQDQSTNGILTTTFAILKSDQYGDFKFETIYPKIYFIDQWKALNDLKSDHILLIKMTGRLNPDYNAGPSKGWGLVVPSSVLKIPISIGHKTE